MVEPLSDLLQRQVGAVEELEARLRALELIVVAGEQRFTTTALDEVETAAQRLSALELTRTLVLSAHGHPPEIPARELLAAMDVRAGPGLALATLVEELGAATERLEDARERADRAVRAAAADTEQRRHAVQALAGV